MVKIFCGSVAESVTSTTNVVYVRFYSEKNGLESRFDSIFTAMRALDSGVIADSCDPEVRFFFKKRSCLFLNFLLLLHFLFSFICSLFEQTNFFQTKWSGLKKIIIFSENSCHFVDLFSFFQVLLLSQLKISHVIHEPTANS